jgi:chaperonin cofactor prefoldin
MSEDFDPTTITAPMLRQVVQTLMNQVETLHEQTRTQAAEIQRLRDEIARLKGEQQQPGEFWGSDRR